MQRVNILFATMKPRSEKLRETLVGVMLNQNLHWYKKLSCRKITLNFKKKIKFSASPHKLIGEYLQAQPSHSRNLPNNIFPRQTFPSTTQPFLRSLGQPTIINES